MLPKCRQYWLRRARACSTCLGSSGLAPSTCVSIRNAERTARRVSRLAKCEMGRTDVAETRVRTGAHTEAELGVFGE